VKRVLRLFLGTVMAVVVLAVAGVVGVALTFDPNTYKPQIIEAVRRATGRELTLTGPLHLKLALRPTFEATGVSLSNAPGGSRPQMATVGRVEAQFGLLPLLRGRVDIHRLVLVKPDILLETDANGRPNWSFQKPPSEPAQTPSAPSAKGPSLQLDMRMLRVEDGAVTFHDGRTGQTIALAIASFGVDAPLGIAPLIFDLDGAVREVPFKLVGSVGPLDALAQRKGASWPVKLVLTALGGAAQVTGTIAHPESAAGYNLSVAALVPDLAALSPLVHAVLPPLTDFRVSAHVADSGGEPRVLQLHATAGRSDLSRIVPTLVLTHAEVNLPTLQEPAHAVAEGTYDGLKFKVDATADGVAALLPGAPPVDKYFAGVVIDTSDAQLRAHGSIAHPASFSGVDLAVDGSVPDLAALAPLLHLPMPALHGITYEGTVADTGSGLADGIVVRDMHVKSPDADLTADLTFQPAPRPSVSGTIAAASLDLPALRAAWENRAIPPPLPVAASPVQQATASPAPPAAAAPPPAASSPSSVPGADRPLPFAALRQADADIHFSAAVVQNGREKWRNLQTHLVLANGVLALDPFAADLPSGHLEGKATVDASRSPPPVSLVLRAPQLQAAPFIRGVTGWLEVDANLRGVGDTPRALAGSASGRLGLAITDGTVQTTVAEGVLGPILQAIQLSNLSKKVPLADLRCAAVSMTLANGVGTVQAMGVDTNLFTMSGSGSVNFANDTLALRVHPMTSLVGGLGVSLTLNVTGPIGAPQVATNVPGTALDVGRTAGLVIPGPVGLALGALGVDRRIIGDDAPTCAQALAAVRGVAAPQAASPAPPARGPAALLPGKPADVLRRLFR